MLLRLMLAAAILATGGLIPAAAEAQKVGVVDVQKVMEGIPAWGKAVEGLRRDFEKKKAELEAKQVELKKVKDQIDAKRTLTDPKALRVEEEKFMQTAQAFQAEFMKAQQEISEREAGLKETVLARIERVVQDIATSGEYDFVFEAGAENAPNVLFAKKSVVITPQVVEGYKKAFGDQAITAAPKPKAAQAQAPKAPPATPKKRWSSAPSPRWPRWSAGRSCTAAARAWSRG
jgi:outer membrane protein